jgi:hypothetical protein
MNTIVKVAVNYAADMLDAQAWDLDYSLKGAEWDSRARLDLIALQYGLTSGFEVYCEHNTGEAQS